MRQRQRPSLPRPRKPPGRTTKRTGCSRPCAPAAATGPVPPANWAWTEPHYGANSRNIYRNNQYIQQVALLGARPPPQRIVAYMLQRSVASVFRCNSPPPSSPPFRGCAAFPSPPLCLNNQTSLRRPPMFAKSIRRLRKARARHTAVTALAPNLLNNARRECLFLLLRRR